MQVIELKQGQKAKVVGFGPGHSIYRKHLIALGLIPGTSFSLIRKAPLGDPIEIEVRGYSLSLRKDEANILQIEVV